MGKPYSRDLRERFVTLLEEGMSAQAAGRRLLVARSTAARWGLIWRREQRAVALAMGGDRRSGKLEAHSGKILSMVEGKPDIFLDEIVGKLASDQVVTSRDAVRRLLMRHGITRKKRR